MNTLQTARRNLIRNNRRASVKSLIEQGFKLGSTAKKNFAYTTELWIHHDGSRALIESLNTNLIRYLEPIVYLPAETVVVKAERKRVTYTLDQPIFYGSRLKRLLAPKGFTAEFNRTRGKWHVGHEDGRWMTLSVEELLTITGSELLGKIDTHAAHMAELAA